MYLVLIGMISMNTYAEEVITNMREPIDSEKELLEQMIKTTQLSIDKLAKVRSYANHTIETFIANGVSDFDYSEKSVKFMSEVIDQERPTYSDKAKNRLPTLWGSYYGEALIKRYGGNWVVAGNGWYAVQLDNGHMLLPMLRVDKHILNGREDSIYAQYLSVEIVQKGINKVVP